MSVSVTERTCGETSLLLIHREDVIVSCRASRLKVKGEQVQSRSQKLTAGTGPAGTYLKNRLAVIPRWRYCEHNLHEEKLLAGSYPATPHIKMTLKPMTSHHAGFGGGQTKVSST